LTGGYSEISPGGAQHPLGHENPLKPIYLTGPWGGGLVPIAPPEYASDG